MDIITLKASPRATGKTAAKEVRNNKQVPCVLYGHDSETLHFQVEELALRRLVYTSEVHRLSLDLDGKSYDCILKDVSFHPVMDMPLHADFQLLRAGEKFQLSVPIQFVGKAVGQIEGGEIHFLTHEIEILVLPKDIPDHLEVDVTPLQIGDTLHMEDLSFPDVEIVSPPQQSVVSVTTKKVADLPEEGEGEEGLEGEEGEEGLEEATEGEAEE